jgi:hypothetical protein
MLPFLFYCKLLIKMYEDGLVQLVKVYLCASYYY